MKDIELRWHGKASPSHVDCHYETLQIVVPGRPFPAQAPAAARPDNRLLYGQDLQVMTWLLHNGYGGRFDCIYLDPPYLSHTGYHAQMQIKTDQGDYWLKRPVFRDAGYGQLADYLQNMYLALSLVKPLLSERGSVFVHLDWHASHYVKILLDEIFTPERFINEIVWCYGGGSNARRHFHRKHDVILWYSRGPDYIFHPQHRPYTPGTLQRGLTRVKGDRYRLDDQGAFLQDWWIDIPKILSPTALDNWKFPTQKPVQLLERILLSSTEEGSLVGDFYAGSGTMAEACEKLGRKWVVGDGSDYAIQTSVHRLLRNHSRPFELGSLQGRYPRAGNITARCIRSGDGQTMVRLENYQPGENRSEGLFWIDFWELGWMEKEVFFSVVSGLPKKRAFPVPTRMTVAATKAQNWVVQVWDINGGNTLLHLN